MKKTAFLTFPILVLPTLCFAQFEVTLRGGMNYPFYQFQTQSNLNVDSKFGCVFGSQYSHKIMDLLSLQLETNFSQVNYKSNVNIVDSSGKNVGTSVISASDWSMDVPIMLKYNPWESELFLHAGFQNYFSFAKSGNSSIVSVLNQHDRYTCGILVGMSYEIIDRLFLDARFTFGLTKNYIYPSEYRRNIFEFTIGYKILKD